MNFALNSMSAGAVAQLVPVNEVGSGLTSWLLVDAALLDRRQLAWAVAASGWHTVNTLSGSRLEAFGDSAPHMIAMRGDPLAVSQGLERLVAIDRTAPAFSAFASPSSVDELQRLFRYLGDARIDQDMDVYCRFADTRVLPSLLALQTPEQAERVGRSISVWKWLVDAKTLANGSVPPRHRRLILATGFNSVRRSSTQCSTPARPTRSSYCFLTERPSLCRRLSEASFISGFASS